MDNRSYFEGMKIMDAGEEYIIEIKCVEKLNQMDEGCKRALEQIRTRDYGAEARDEGYETILNYGICFCRKSCKVKAENLNSF